MTGLEWADPAANGASAGRDGSGDMAAEDLPLLIEKAMLARHFTQMHKHAARRCLSAARAAERRGEHALVTAMVRDAKDEHMRARACSRYARQCERRAEDIGIAAGAYTATGRGKRPVFGGVGS